MAENFSDIGRVEAIRRLFEGTPYKPFEAAMTLSGEPSGSMCASRTFTEGVDFDLVYFPLTHLGYKCASAVSGALAASFMKTKTMSVVLSVSAKLDFEQVALLWKGIVAAASEAGAEKLTLDLAPSPNGLTVNISAMGTQSEKFLSSLPAPQSKDILCVSGSLGAAYVGMRLLEQEKARFEASGEVSATSSLEKYKMLVGAYLKPEAVSRAVAVMEEEGVRPSLGAFVTKGLADAMKSIMRRTGLGVKVYADRIPFEGNTFEVAREMGFDPVSAAMNGGEDNVLLLTVNAAQYEVFRKAFPSFDAIGHLAVPEAGAVIVTPDGLEHEVTAPGWDGYDG